MKKLYWRPNRVSRVELLFIAAFSLAGLVLVESFPQVKKQRFYQEKMTASRLALVAMRELKQERHRRKIPIHDEADPARTGLIGDLLSPIASNSGHLGSKQTSVNPNFAAVLVHYLRRAEVNPGDVVAVGVSGSFPAINVSAYAALKTLEAKPSVVASTSASQWGATHPHFTWLDMEACLQRRRVFSTRAVAASLGGIDDRALGLSNEGKRLLRSAVERAGIPLLSDETFEDAVETRMKLYADHARGRPIKAYINVGGGTVSVGTHIGKKLFHPGLNRSAPVGGETPDSVMLRFAHSDVPVIHMSGINRIAERYGFPISPVTMPRVGEGKVFVTVQYNPWLTAGVLLAIVGLAILFLRLHVGMRLSSSMSAPKQRSAPSEMV
ncbi:MAG: poly-gamma-glutamate system protein [Myxococcales bacterium]|nr:poly-gamma-glutamate system protein [Myxococcales bacterium]